MISGFSSGIHVLLDIRVLLRYLEKRKFFNHLFEGKEGKQRYGLGWVGGKGMGWEGRET